MPPTDSPQNQARQMLALLWRNFPTQGQPAPTPHPKHGPKPGLNHDQLVKTAISLADAEGLSALTIRRVAQTLQVSPMSLYTYVNNKAELIELMIDAVYFEGYTLSPQDKVLSQKGKKKALNSTPKNWREQVQALAQSNLELFLRHPWLIESYSERPPLGPGVMFKYETELNALEGWGLSDVDLDASLSFVLNFVRAAARDIVQAQAAQQQNSNAEWWQAHEVALLTYVNPKQFPLSSRVGSAAGAANQGAYNAKKAYNFGLDRVMAGLAPLFES